MAKFEIALEKTLAFEGGYSNNPNDAGGETIFGISRRWFPKWEGWETLDEIHDLSDGKINIAVALPDGTINIVLDNQLRKDVERLYYNEFWTPLHGDEIESQEIANYLFDFAVNSGHSDAVKALQNALNAVYPLNLNDVSETVTVDGVIGRRTLYAIMDLSELYWRELLACFRSYRLHHILKNIGNRKIHVSFATGLAERAMK